MSIAGNILSIKKNLPAGVKLIAVSKTRPASEIMEAYNYGHHYFGENKAQELSAKSTLLPADVEWHFIGHLQSNKIKYIAPFVSLIHSVDSLKLLMAIDREAVKNQRVIPCLLQFFIASEDTKFGLTYDEAVELLLSAEYSVLKNIVISGVMGMATYTDNENQIRTEFRELRSVFDRLKNEFFMESETFCEISMGMSDDFLIAVEEGSTMVRIGSSIFGERIYP